VFTIVVVVVAIVVATITNDVINAGNVVDFQWCPSSLHKCPHPCVGVPHPLETLCHAPS